MKSLTVLSAVIALAAGGYAAPAEASQSETPHLEFVQWYIKGLAAVERLRDSGEQELARSTTDGKVLSMIHISERMVLELRSQLVRLQTMRISAPFDGLIPNLIQFDQQKIAIYEQLGEISSQFVGAQRNDVDYGKLAAALPRLRAVLESIDKTILKDATPMALMTLINRQPDSKGHLTHLIITRQEKTDFLHQLSLEFGNKLNEKHPGTIVSSGCIAASFLKARFASDDPWL